MKLILLSFLHGDLSFQILTIIISSLILTSAAMVYAGQATGEMFIGQTDIGNVIHKGAVKFNAANKTYTITGSGTNIWANEDAFFYVWRKAKGDLSLSTDLKWIGAGKHEHRKGGWMVRGGLEKDDPYVDIAAHGDGLISMQYRLTKGGTTSEVKAPVKGPVKMLLERTGDQFSMTLTKNGKIIYGGTISLHLEGEIYAGLAVCSHDSSTSETAVFSNVIFIESDSVPVDKRVVESTLEIIDIDSGIRSIVRRAKEHFEAPNWSRDGKTFYYNSGGLVYTLPVKGGTPKLLNTNFAEHCNNDHGLSPDGKQFVISHHGEDGKSKIYILSSKGGEPKLLTENGPSYWHGWSPDGKTLAYCAERNGEYDVYSIPVEGGTETRLTTAPGLDDGPDYSPDGKYIYFNSVRTGQMKIWRMKSDGSEQTKITPDDNYGDWFAHPSPDGKWIVFVSFDKSVDGHPANKDVVLQLMSAAADGEAKIIATLFGGQGTINVPSWSPDSKKIAFVSYRLVAP